MSGSVLERWRAGLAVGELRLPRCGGCGRLVAHPRPRCPWCTSAEQTDEILSGIGTVYSFTVIRRAQGAFAGTEPYAVGYVRLSEGPMLLARLDALDLADLAVDVSVLVTPDPEGRLTFRLVDPSSDVPTSSPPARNPRS